MPRKAMSKVGDPQPLVMDGVRYRSHANYVEAIDVQSDKPVWHTVLYPGIEPEHPNSRLEKDAQWNIVSAIKIVGDKIEARDGKGNAYELDRKTGKIVRHAVTEAEAIAIARDAVRDLKMPPGIEPQMEEKDDFWIATFPMQLPKGRRGPDYYAQIHVDRWTGKVMKILVGS